MNKSNDYTSLPIPAVARMIALDDLARSTRRRPSRSGTASVTSAPADGRRVLWRIWRRRPATAADRGT